MSAAMSTPGQGGPVDLQDRLERAEAEIARLRQDLLASRAEVRSLAESIPDAISRRGVVRSILVDLAHPRAWLGFVRRRLLARGLR